MTRAKDHQTNIPARRYLNLNDVRFHDLRHTFASRLVQMGVPLYDVMHFTGHKSFDMVQRYSHLAPGYQERGIQALNAFGTNTAQSTEKPIGPNDKCH
jgi:integrase